MRLYNISEEDIEKAIIQPDKGPEVETDRYVVILAQEGKFKGMPLKVIYVLEKGDIVVISAYPLKKSYWR